MLVSLTVGKVDAGVAVLLTEDKRHIEFPSILLPPSITSGSIVDITVAQNHNAEQQAEKAFESLQERILNRYGMTAPSTPVLRLRNATQTSLVLEWDPIQLATSTLKSLALYRNGSKAGNIPRPMEMLSTKISGLAVDTEFSFYLVLRTSGGTYHSNNLTVRTHKMTDLTGITITPGVLPPQLHDSLEVAVERIGAKISDTVRIDTTHFVCTEGRGKDWEKAVEMNIPVVRPEWIEGCEREGKIIGVRDYYLDAKAKNRNIGPSPSLNQPASTPQAPSQSSLPMRSPAPPKSPDAESVAQGEPGPTQPPTPKDKELPLPPTPQVEEGSEDSEEADTEDKARRAQADSDEDEDEDEEEDEATKTPKGKSVSQTNIPQAGKSEGSGDMEEVAL